MTTLTAYHPLLMSYDFAKEFFDPKKSSANVYEPWAADFGTMLTVNFKNNVAVHSGEEAAMFDYKAYFVHFFLGLLFVGQETELKTKFGIKNAFWLYEDKQLKIFIFKEQNGKKLLLLKTINLDPSRRQKDHTWSDLDLKSVFSLMENINENVASYAIESHWLDVYAENLHGDFAAEVVAPYIFSVLDINDEVKVDNKIIVDSTKMKRKSRKNYRKVDSTTKDQSAIEKMLIDLGSPHEPEATRGLENLLTKSAKLFKQNMYGTITNDFDSFSSISQCGFVHGLLISFQKKFSLQIRMEQIHTSVPGYRIKVHWKPYSSWNKMINSLPIQLDFLPGLEKMNKKGDVVPVDQMRKFGGFADAAFESISSRVLLAYVNFNSDKKTCLVKTVGSMVSARNLVDNVQDMAAITLSVPIMDKLEELKVYLDLEFTYALGGHLPANKKNVHKHLSRFLHGYFAADQLSKNENSIYKLEPVNPSWLEKKHMTSFLMKTAEDTVDLVLNIFEKQRFGEVDYNEISKILQQRRYPRTHGKVKVVVIVDYFVSFSNTKRPEYKCHILTAGQAKLKSVPSEQHIDFKMIKIEHLNLINEFSKFVPQSDGSPKGNGLVLSKIRNYFDHNFGYIESAYEMKAVVQGLLSKVRTQSNIMDLKKNVLQVGFIEGNEAARKLCLVNLAFGAADEAIMGLDGMRHIMESKLMKDFDNVKVINLAMVKKPEDGELRTIVAGNWFLSILGQCMGRRMKRDAMCSMEELDPIKTLLGEKETETKAQVQEFKPSMIVKRRRYLETLGKVSSGIMYGLMAKDFISDLIHGNIAGMAINAGFIFSNILTSHLADRFLSKAALLVNEDRMLLAGILRASSPFLRRCPSFAFVGFDLYNSIKAYKNNQSEVLVNIVADGSYIALDLAETAIEISEAFGLIEGVSSVTGPIGWTVGAALLVGADIYRSVKIVENIDDVIHLTRLERFTEGIRAFFGMDPEEHVQKLMQQKRIFSDTIAQMTSFLNQHQTIKRYIFPLKLTESNITNIDLRRFSKFSVARSIPQLSSTNKYFCLPTLKDVDTGSSEILFSYLCNNAFGLENMVSSNGTNLTYIQLAPGNGRVFGAIDAPNVFDITSRGAKAIFGGKNDNMFTLRNNKSSGSYLSGGLGNNVLDISNMNETMKIQFSEHGFFVARKPSIAYNNITTIVGRKNIPDTVIAWCGLRHIELHGGEFSNDDVDRITVPENLACLYNLTMVVTSGGDTHVVNNANRGDFTYIVTNLDGNFQIKLNEKINQSHNFIFDYSSFDLRLLSYELNSSGIYVKVSLPLNNSGLIEIPSAQKNQYCTFSFKDGASLHFSHKHAVLKVETSLTIDEAISLYSNLASMSNISLVIHSLSDDQTVTLNHHMLKNDQDKYAIDIIHSSQDHTYIKSVAHELIYILKANEPNDRYELLPDIKVEVAYANPQKIIIDMHHLLESAKLQHQLNDLVLKPIIQNDDVIIEIFLKNRRNEVSFFKPVSNITLENAMKNSSYENILIRKRSSMLLRMAENSNLSLLLSPVPIVFDKSKNLILICPDDDLDFGSEVHFDVELLKYDCFKMKDSDLMITNVLKETAVDNEFPVQNEFTLILKDFFINDMMQSLKLKFDNRIIDFHIDFDIDTVKSVNYLMKRLALEFIA